MTEKNVNGETADARDRARPLRRSFLIAVAGTLVSVPTAAAERRLQEADGELELVADFEPPDLPENITIDGEGTIYLSMGPTGEIRAIDPDGAESTVATLDTGEEGLLLGLTIDNDTIYAANASGEDETHGVWRIEVGGEAERLASLPADESMPNGITRDPSEADTLLVSDHLGGAIWRVAANGEAEPWVEHSLLEPDMDADSPVGADGLAVHPDGDVYVDNLNFGTIIRVPVESDGGAGEPEKYVQDDALIGADGMTFDENGALYVAVNAADEVVRITSDREIESIAASDDLDSPADVSFGTTEEEATSLYVCNFAYATFLEDEEAADPSLMKVDVDVRGFFPEEPVLNAGSADNE